MRLECINPADRTRGHIRPGGVNGYEVIAIVAREHGLTVDQLISRTRVREISWPRQMALYLMEQHCPHLSWPHMGRLVNLQCHSTVAHALRQAEARLETADQHPEQYGPFRDAYERCERAVELLKAWKR